MNVIGLGNVGSKIAKCFEKYPQYSVFTIANQDHGDTVVVKEQSHPEKYESLAPNLEKIINSLEDEVLFIVCGASFTSALSLVVLEQLKHKPVDVLYIKTDTEMLSQMKKMHEKVVYNVLQQKARSGAFRNLYIVSNQKVEETLGDLPVIGFWDKINDFIASTFHMVNVYTHQDPVMGVLEAPPDTCRISTVGVKELSGGQETDLFELDSARATRYMYGVNEDRLKASSDTLKKIKSELKTKITEDHSVSYGIYPTTYKVDYCWFIKSTSIIQS